MQARHDFPHRIHEFENEWVPLGDGTRLAARIWLPADARTRPVPAILEYIPYRKRDFTAIGDALTHPYFAGHGYASVRVDIRGSGDSDGRLRDEYLGQEQDDALEVLRWIASQEWCTGSVGMIGISWGGFSALQVAARRPPELKAIIAVCASDDRYADDVHYMGGCVLNDGVSWGSGIFTVIPRPPDPMLVGERWREMWRERLENATLPLATWLSHQHRDAYWQHGSVAEHYDAIACPVFAVGGWVDGYSNAILRLMERLEVPRRALIGPWTHVYPHFGIPAPAVGFLQEALRWWDQWLKGEERGMTEEPRLRIWMQERIRPHPSCPQGAGRWVAEPEWPVRACTARSYALNPGRLSPEAEPEVRIGLRSPCTTGLAGGEWCPLDGSGSGPEFQSDQREDDGRSLCFDSAPLTERLEILGAPVANLMLAADRPCAQLAVRLCDVAPDGTSTRVTFALLNLTHREGSQRPVPMRPGEVAQVSVRLNDTAYAFPPGHRLRLALSTSYWPMAWPSPEPVTLTLVSGASGLELPVRVPRPEDRCLRPFDPPESSPALRVSELQPAEPTRRIEHDVDSGETVLTHAENRGTRRLEDIDLVIGSTATERYRIREGEPASARTEMERSVTWARGEWRVRLETRLVLSSTRENFHLAATIEAFENEKRFLERQFDETIARDLV